MRLSHIGPRFKHEKAGCTVGIMFAHVGSTICLSVTFENPFGVAQAAAIKYSTNKSALNAMNCEGRISYKKDEACSPGVGDV